MKGSLKTAILLVSLATCLLQVPAVTAEQSKQVPPAPIPPQILSAKKVFIANAGGEQPSEDSQYSGDADRAYNQFYAAMKTWGRYELVETPADADLWFEIRFTAPPASRPVSQGNTLGTAEFDPQFRVVIRDPKTSAILWAFTEHADWALLKGNRDRNFDLGMTRIVTDVQRLSAQTADGASKK
jgi:hypothetical protein